MSEPGSFDDMREGSGGMDTSADPYTIDSSTDIYATPEVSMDVPGVTVEETSQAVSVTDTQGLFSGSGQTVSPYDGQMYNSPYDAANNNPYYNNTYQNNTYRNNPYQNNPYQSNTYQDSGSYGNGQPQQGMAPYQNDPYNGNAYNTDNTYGGSLYGAGNTYNANNAYGGGMNNNYNYGANNRYGENGYGSACNGGNPYAGQQADGGFGGRPPYGSPPYGDNPYSPYAAPQKKTHTGLIITITVIVILLFIVAVCALVYRAMELTGADDRKPYINSHHGKYEFDDDYDYHHDYDDDFYGYDDDEDFFYGGDYDFDYDDDKYYSLQDDLKYDLSYDIDFEIYDYETDDEDVYIMVTYPVISGEDVPNRDTLNEAIYSEVTEITEYFEEEYAPYMEKNEDSYFSASAVSYVTYMDEDKLSVVFQESIYTDTYYLPYLYCINIDMANGVVLDNQEMLSIDDSFSVEFRTRSDEQNGGIRSLTNMTDQEITGYFNSSDVIVFYTPMGMEIGFNYENGWVTVTYEEYEQYLNVF